MFLLWLISHGRQLSPFCVCIFLIHLVTRSSFPAPSFGFYWPLRLALSSVIMHLRLNSSVPVCPFSSLDFPTTTGSPFCGLHRCLFSPAAFHRPCYPSSAGIITAHPLCEGFALFILIIRLWASWLASPRLYPFVSSPESRFLPPISCVY